LKTITTTKDPRIADRQLNAGSPEQEAGLPTT